MKLYTPTDIREMSQSRFFKQAALRSLNLAYDIMLSHNAEKQIFAKDFYQQAGRPDKKLGAYFTSFFQETRPHRAGHWPNTYTVRSERLPTLEKHVCLSGQTLTLLQVAQQTKRSFLLDPGPRSKLPRTGNRVYPWWAMMRRDIREKLFLEERGNLWDYDIANCKPTIMLQQFDTLVKKKSYPRRLTEAELAVTTWRKLVQSPKTVRQALASDLGITYSEAKTKLQAVCNSAYVASVGALAHDWDLKDHPTYVGLRQDFQTIWAVLRQFQEEGEKAGQCLQRLYELAEDTIMSALETTFEPGEQVWWIHDGFMLDHRTSTRDKEELVKEKTGYQITLTGGHTRPDTHNVCPDKHTTNSTERKWHSQQNSRGTSTRVPYSATSSRQ